MQIPAHTSAQKGNFYPLMQGFSEPTNSDLRVTGSVHEVKAFNNVLRYHEEVVSHLSVLKEAAPGFQTDRLVFQEKFICLAMQTINEYSRLLIAITDRMVEAGLKKQGNMILAGSSILLGGNCDGSFFQKAALVTEKKFGLQKVLFKLNVYRERKGDHGIYTAFIQELLENLASFCYDHFLYKDIIDTLKEGN